MKKERKDGLFMDNSIYMFDEKRGGFPIYTRVIQLITIIIGSWSSLGLLIEALAVPADYLIINLAILLCAGLLFVLCIVPNLDLVKLFFGLLFYGLFLYSRLPMIRNAFYIIENQVIERITSYYEFETYRFAADYSRARIDTTLFVIMIVIPVVAMISIAVIRNRLVNLAGIILFLPVVLCFSFGLIPSERYLITYLAAVLYMSRSSFRAHKSSNKDQRLLLHRINSSAAIWLSIICLGIFFLLKMIVSKEEYEAIPEIKETKNELQNTMFNLNWEDFTEVFSDIYLFSDQRATGGLNGGQLGKVGEVDFNESEQLRVTAPKEAIETGVYLKGYVGSEYTGDKWDQHSEDIEKEYNELKKNFIEDNFNPEALLGNTVEEQRNNGFGLLTDVNPNPMSIEYEDANKKFLYIPYVTNYEGLNNIEFVQDLYAAPKKKKSSYTLDFHNFMFSNITEDMLYKYILFSSMFQSSTDSENVYNRFVKETYTVLPDHGVERLKEEFSSVKIDLRAGISAVFSPKYEPLLFTVDQLNTQFVATIVKINYVSNYLNNNTRYSLSPGKLPPGKDFVEYFLYENKVGYCSHYASAATLMLRAMNIPARYVEGYAVSPGDIQLNSKSITQGESNDDEKTLMEVSVKDYNAHAWVEVYFDGMGWIPVDFTPASVIGYAGLGLEGEDANRVAPTRTPYTQSQEDSKPVPSKKPTPVPRKPIQNTPKDETVSKGSGTTKTEKERIDSLFLMVFLVLMIVVSVSVVTLLIIKNKKNLKIENHNRRVIVLLMKIEKILAACQELGKRGACLEESEEYVKEHCAYIDKDIFNACMEIARKARFGKDSITPEELNQVEALHCDLYEKAYKEQSLLTKMYLKILYSVN